MFSKEKGRMEKENLVRLSMDDLTEVNGGIIFDKTSYFLVINTSGMAMVLSKVYYGGNGQMSKQEAAMEAQRLDAIDYSIK